MKICLNRGTTGGGLPLDEFVARASAAGFHGADVDLAWAQTHGVSGLSDLFQSHGLAFGGWGPPADWRGDAGVAAEGVDALRKHAAVASELKIDACATWIMPSGDLPFIENWNFHVARLKPMAAALAHYGLRFGLEFVGPYHLRRKFKHEFIFTPGLMLELADAVGPNVGLLVDVFHLHCSGTPFAHLAGLPAAKIVLAHLNDAPRVPVHEVEDGVRLLPGDGAIDLPAFLSALKQTGYAGPVSLEVFNTDLRTLPPEEAAERAWAATRRVIGDGKNY